MGLILGKADLEKPKYDVVEKGAEYEIRRYAPYLVAEITYNGTHLKSGDNGGFMTLANYLGVTGKPYNIKAGAEGGEGEKIAMTSPVITQEELQGEKIAMTSPVITSESDQGKAGSEAKPSTTMQFMIPSKYTMETVPKPTDPRVTVKEVPSKLMGAITFSGFWDDASIATQRTKLRRAMEACGWKITGDYILARYNPPWTIPFLRTNEVLYPVEKVEA